jgi:phosphomannomutase
VRVIVRPSGTEPKLKAYLETVVRVHAHTGVPAARARGADELDQLRAEMSAAHGL